MTGATAAPLGAATPVVRSVAQGLTAGALAAPVLALGRSPSGRELVTTGLAVVLAVLVASGVDRLSGPGGTVATRVAGLVVVAASAVASIVTPSGLSTAIIAALLGAGVGLLGGLRGRTPGFPYLIGLGGAVAATVLLRTIAGDATWIRWWPVLLAAVGFVGGLGERPIDAAGHRSGRRWALGASVAGAVALLAWTGANDPQLSWFGPVVANGPRDRPAVAITFDDGPNDPYSLAIADVLESRGARGTFYMVGSAIDRNPEIVQTLVERGHQVGNHSYHHDYWRWLDPRYPELGRTQDAFERAIGRCPTTYRPPHGQRTPFISGLVAASGMRTITWDTSAMDWTLTDGREVARRVLDRVQPGSIVLLHDGLDGIPDADRQVVLDALPIILDGLEARGLRAVRVDELVDTGGGLTDC